jgi:hypothetical protein
MYEQCRHFELLLMTFSMTIMESRSHFTNCVVGDRSTFGRRILNPLSYTTRTLPLECTGRAERLESMPSEAEKNLPATNEGYGTQEYWYVG